MVRSRESWTRRQRWKNDAIFATASVAVRVGLALPRRWLPAAGTLLGAMAYNLLFRARVTALDNLARVYPAMSARELRHMARQVFAALGRNLTDTLTLLDPTEVAGRTLQLPQESTAELARVLALGRGAVYITAHLGPWERMAALLAAEGFPITTVARESYDPRFHQLVYDPLRLRRNVQAIYRGASNAPLAMVRALRQGRVLGFLIDLPGRIPTVPGTLVGLPARLPLGPVRIALRMRAPVVVGTPAPSPSGTSREIAIRHIPTFDLHPDEEGEHELLRRVADALSDRIRALPTEWPWMHPFVRLANGANVTTSTVLPTERTRA